MTILVTGGAGFIGSHLVDKLLEEGKQVIALDNFDDYYQRSLKEKNIERAKRNDHYKLIEKDIRDKEAVRTLLQEHSIEYVFHMAARAGVRPSIQHPLLYNDINVNGTLTLLQLCRDTGVKKFIYASSSSVYGDATHFPTHEDLPPKPISPYGASKLAAENFCHAFASAYGLKTVSLRIFTAYGPRQRPDEAVYKFTNLIFNNRKITVYGDGHQTRDFTHISDIVDGFILAMKKPVTNEAINIGSGKRISVQELIQLLEEVTGKKITAEYTETQKGDVPNTWADISKAKKLLGYDPHVGMKAGIEKFVEWWRSERA